MSPSSDVLSTAGDCQGCRDFAPLCIVDKQADFNESPCVLKKADGGRGIVHTFGRHALPMVWDFAEANPFNQDIASWASSEAEVSKQHRDVVGGSSQQSDPWLCNGTALA